MLRGAARLNMPWPVTTWSPGPGRHRPRSPYFGTGPLRLRLGKSALRRRLALGGAVVLPGFEFIDAHATARMPRRTGLGKRPLAIRS